MMGKPSDRAYDLWNLLRSSRNRVAPVIPPLADFDTASLAKLRNSKQIHRETARLTRKKPHPGLRNKLASV